MKTQILPLLLCTGLTSGLHAESTSSPATDKKTTTRATESKADLDARMNWWRSARFGMFVHWGLYSGPAGNWNGKSIGTRGGMEWLQQRVGVDTYTYAAAAIPLFKPKADFATEWAKVAKQSGCKYIVFTTKHHDGFALHDSKLTNYDAGDVVGRDLVKEITDALRSEKLKVGFYHSLIDWHHPQYDFTRAKGLPYPKNAPKVSLFPRDHSKYVEFLHGQVKELANNYGPVDVWWWDYSKPEAEGAFWGGDALVNLVRTANPKTIMNNRIYRTPHINKHDALDRLLNFNRAHGDFTTPEQTVPSRGVKGVDWEQCMTMNTTWGYSTNDHTWKSSKKLIRTLVDIASKGGNFLLNVGPKGDGSIPEESLKCMKDIGDWMKVNGEAIYGTSASPFTKLDFDGRCTAKGNTLYLHVFKRPETSTISIATQATSATLLAGGVKLSTKRKGDSLVITLPQSLPDNVATVIKVVQ